jgi:tetratricopeptide (TPR) repeat protein
MGTDAGEPDLGAEGAPEQPAEPPEPVVVAKKDPPKRTPPKRTPPKKTPKPKASNNADSLKQEARAAHTRGNLNQARKLYHDALDINGTDAEILAGLGKVYFDQANYREAAKYQTRAVRHAPGRNDYRISLGQSFYRLKKYDTAIGVWKKVLERDPGNSVAKQYIMLAERKLGN